MLLNFSNFRAKILLKVALNIIAIPPHPLKLFGLWSRYFSSTKNTQELLSEEVLNQEIITEEACTDS
jgi:hypothetical protein